MLRRPTSPEKHGTSSRALASNVAWTVSGVALGLANTVRHRIIGYGRPRPFGPDDIMRNVDYSLDVVNRWRDRGLRPDGLHVLELGPGSDLGTGFVLVALGAASYTAVDRFSLATAVDPEFYRSLADRLNVGVDATLRRMHYTVGALSETVAPPTGFDAFVSNATLEHLEDIKSAFAWMASVGSPSAKHIHLVDAQTHMRWVRTHDPWNILRYPELIYRLALSFPGAPNRMLASDYVAEASRSGLRFEVLEETQMDPVRLRRIRPFLARVYRDRDDADLRRLTFTLVSENEAGPGISRRTGDQSGSSHYSGEPSQRP
jgi:hypothetical protein